MERLKAVVDGREIFFDYCRIGNDISIQIFGGDQSHIGAISIAKGGMILNTFQMPGHRDSVITESVSSRVSKAFDDSVILVSCGIHFNNASQETIDTIVDAVRLLTNRLLTQ